VVVDLRPGGSWGRVPAAAAGAVQLGARALRVLIAIASFANGEGECWPRQRLIGEMTGIKDRRGLHREIAALVAAGLLKVDRRRRADGASISNLYTVDLEAPPRVSGGAPKGTKTDRTNHGEQKGEERGMSELGRGAPSLHSKEEIAEVDRLVAETTALLTGRRPSIADPVAYVAGTKEWKRQNRLATLNKWVGQRFDGDDRMEAWEAIAEAASASSRAETSRHANSIVDRLDKLHRAENPT
jgi:hypothetical protein